MVNEIILIDSFMMRQAYVTISLLHNSTLILQRLLYLFLLKQLERGKQQFASIAFLSRLHGTMNNQK